MSSHDEAGGGVFRLEEIRAAAAIAYRQTFFPNPQRPRPVDPTKCLYHYTSTAGLIGILQSKTLRAGDTAFLNDSLEIGFAAEPLLDRMMEHVIESFRPLTKDGQVPTKADGSIDGERIDPDSLSLKPDAPELKKLHSIAQTWEILGYYASTVRERLIERREMNFSYVDGGTFVACLSEARDDLGQWRGYGRGGFAIGFRRESLTESAPVLRPVEYGDDAVNQLCNIVLQHFDRFDMQPDGGLSAYVEAVSFCLPQIALVKHQSFAQEKEWRLVVPRYSGDYSNVKVLARGQDLVPYVECAFPTAAVAEIVIGPGGDFHAVRAVRALLQEHGYDTNTVCISQSTAPFRG